MDFLTVKGLQWYCNVRGYLLAVACRDVQRPAPTTMKLIEWKPCPANSCLSMLIFGSNAHLHIKIRWLPVAIAPSAPLSSRLCLLDSIFPLHSKTVIHQ